MKQIFRLGALAAAALIAAAPASAAAPAAASAAARPAASAQAGKRLTVLADEYYDALARFEPLSASESGDNRYADQIGLSISPQLRAKQFARAAAVAAGGQGRPLDRGDEVARDGLT